MGNGFSRRRLHSFATQQPRRQCASCHGCAIAGGNDVRSGTTGATYGIGGAIAGGYAHEAHGIGGAISGGEVSP